MKTSFSTSCLPCHREHTDNQRPRQALATPIQIRRNPTDPSTLGNVGTHLQRSRRHQPPLCRDHQRCPDRLVTEQLTLSTRGIPTLSLKRAAQERRQSSSLLHLSAPDYQRRSQNRHCRNTKERRPPHRDVDRHRKCIGFLTHRSAEGLGALSERTMCGTSKVDWFGLASLPRLLASDLVIHVGRNESDGLAGLACREHFISGDVASANGDE